MDHVLEAIIAHWGERCAEFEPECHCCKAWQQYDALESAADDLCDLAARYDELRSQFLLIRSHPSMGADHVSD